ncbi:MAG: molybdopterin-dependent oxidoreductase, partial [Proteobacteria bacterium]|nr:molybdopterin-dependent oxidoreductase [Pseudomonadota bacterium]
HMIFSARNRYKVPVELITSEEECGLDHKVDMIHRVGSYYDFVKAVNYYLLSSGLQNQMFINDRSLEFENYKSKLLAEDFDDLFEKSGVCCIDELAEFAKGFNNEMNGVLVFSEKEVSSNVSFELFNMAIITGKLGKTAQGIVALKEKNNSQGIIDMGACHKVAPGFQPYDNPQVVQKLKAKWGVEDLPTKINSPYKLMKENKLKNVFIFGEDPLGCAIDKPEVEGWFEKVDFMMVQDYFLTETAQKADLILPASLPFEIGGSFTNTQKHLQKFEAGMEPATEIASPHQLIELMGKLGLSGFSNMDEALWEMFSLLPPPADPETRKYQLHHTMHDNFNRQFNHGCDIVNKRFDEEFEEAF